MLRKLNLKAEEEAVVDFSEYDEEEMPAWAEWALVGKVLCDKLRISQCRLTGFYGEPRRERRKDSWYLLRFLRAQSAWPLLCLGNFNEVLSAEEQIGGNEREHWKIVAFQDVVNDCRLSDLGYHGLPYT
jgi:hypothetical protein